MTPIEKAIRRATSATSVSEGDPVQSLWDGYGEVLRFELRGASVSSVIVKHVSPPRVNKPRRGDADSAHQRKLRSYEVEAHFYQAYASRSGPNARLPKAYACQKTEQGFLFILEDLDLAGYPGRRHSLTEAERDACLRWLAAFHATFLGVEPVGLWKSGTYWQLGARAEELSKMIHGALRLAAPKLDARLHQCRFKTLLHGDAKPANFCFPIGAGNVAAVDFQYTGGGCGMKDVAYLLDCCISEGAHGTGGSEAEQQTQEALDTYFSALRGELESQASTLDIGAVETEWRALYPIAWADFARFLDGWAPGQYPPGDFGRKLIQAAIAACG